MTVLFYYILGKNSVLYGFSATDFQLLFSFSPIKYSLLIFYLILSKINPKPDRICSNLLSSLQHLVLILLVVQKCHGLFEAFVCDSACKILSFLKKFYKRMLLFLFFEKHCFLVDILLDGIAILSRHAHRTVSVKHNIDRL